MSVKIYSPRRYVNTLDILWARMYLVGMNKIYVSPFKLKSGQWSARRILWASFHSSMDMNLFSDQLRAQNPDWLIETYEAGRKRAKP